MTNALLSLVPDPTSQSTTATLENLLAASPVLMETFECACKFGVVALRNMVPQNRTALLENGHQFRDFDTHYEETYLALQSVDETFLPDSPLLLENILERTQARV